MRQKDNLEYHAVVNFIAEYNRTHKRQLHLVSPCNPPMPDTMCRLNGKEIGVEVVHTYGSNEEAAMRLGNLKSDDIPEKIHRKRRQTPIIVRALNSLNVQGDVLNLLTYIKHVLNNT